MPLCRSVMVIALVTGATAFDNAVATSLPNSSSNFLGAVTTTAALATNMYNNVTPATTTSSILDASSLGNVTDNLTIRALIDTLLPSELSTGTEISVLQPTETPSQASKTRHSSKTASANDDEIGDVWYSTVTESNGRQLVIVNTIAYVTATGGAGPDSTTTKKVKSTAVRTSTYYVIPTTITNSENVTTTVTITPSSTSAIPVSTVTSSGSGTVITWCLPADANTKVPCPSTTRPDAGTTATTSAGTSTSPSPASSYAVNLNGAAKVVKTAGYSSVPFALAALFLADALNPFSLAFVVTDVLTQEGVGSLIFVCTCLVFGAVGLLVA